mmetsp:Transcript_71583/g.185853  ORF Transcript_71583/g.185853 Transcript_71583/m.185853 type:complete len:201 (-) Transcript_71583:957-1559(-)
MEASSGPHHQRPDPGPLSSRRLPCDPLQHHPRYMPPRGLWAAVSATEAAAAAAALVEHQYHPSLRRRGVLGWQHGRLQPLPWAHRPRPRHRQHLRGPRRRPRRRPSSAGVVAAQTVGPAAVSVGTVVLRVRQWQQLEWWSRRRQRRLGRMRPAWRDRCVREPCSRHHHHHPRRSLLPAAERAMVHRWQPWLHQRQCQHWK